MALDDMKRLVRQHIELSWNKGRLALAEQLQSKDFLYKSSFIGRSFNSAAYCQMVQNIRDAIPYPRVPGQAQFCRPGFVLSKDRAPFEDCEALPGEEVLVQRTQKALLR